jgi:sugar/nucleoside kinase (ribokinase family)
MHPSPVRDLDLLVLGDCNPDVMVLGRDLEPAFGQQEKLVDGMSLVIGGSASIMAVAAARLGLRVALVAAIGADAAGEFMLGQLAAEGVDTGAMVIRPGQATAMTVVLSRGSDRGSLTALGAMPTLTAADVPAALLARARHLHVSSYFLLERSLGPGLAGLFATARAAGTTSSLDTNWDPAGRWGDQQLQAVLRSTDVLLPNEAEALKLSRSGTIGDAVAALAAGGTRLVVKLGQRGALSAEGEQWHAVSAPAALAGDYVDATGAGDCCDAGIVAGWLGGLDLPSCAALGCAVGSASTRAAGGTGVRTDMAAALALAKSAAVAQVPAVTQVPAADAGPG